MSFTCPKCNAGTEQRDRFCPSCGTRFAQSATAFDSKARPDHTSKQKPPHADATTTASSAAQDIHPLPSVPLRATTRKRRSRPKPRQWYRRKLFIVPLILLVLGGVGAAGILTYLDSQLSEVNKLSTPPPELSSERLGGDERLTIDTGAAQEAVRNAETTDNDDDAFEDNNVAAAQSSGGVGTPDAFVNTPSSNGSVTILLMGVDARPGEPIDVEVRPDTLAVLHLNGETGSCRMLSVPRDTRTELPGYGLSKVNHALAIGGIPYQALVTQNLLGVEIDHYGLIDFSGIEGLVDAVGGVTVDNGQAFTVGSTTFNAGPINLDGEEALVYAASGAEPTVISAGLIDSSRSYGRSSARLQAWMSSLAPTGCSAPSRATSRQTLRSLT